MQQSVRVRHCRRRFYICANDTEHRNFWPAQVVWLCARTSRFRVMLLFPDRHNRPQTCMVKCVKQGEGDGIQQRAVVDVSGRGRWCSRGRPEGRTANGEILIEEVGVWNAYVAATHSVAEA